MTCVKRRTVYDRAFSTAAVVDGPKHNWPRQRGVDRFFGTITGAGSY
jgi:hypothetical protein